MKRLSVFAVCVASLSIFAGEAAAPPQCDYREFRKDEAAFFDSWQKYIAENTTAKDMKTINSYSYSLVELRLLPKKFKPEVEFSLAYDFINKGENPVRLPEQLKSQPIIAKKKGDDPILVGVGFGNKIDTEALISQDYSRCGMFGLQMKTTHNFDWYGVYCGVTVDMSLVVNGLQIGALSAKATALNGLQIGALTRATYTDSIGIQIGLLNNNGRFTLPGINIVW